ncbi:MAG: hypothetical protein HC927_11740 [Deltaproteobacteria bacterium]|nr:hypothetical protein [Deltaproteobacteria bacterium]
MQESEKPKISAELLHQLLGEYVEKSALALRRHEANLLRIAIGLMVAVAFCAVIVAIPLLELVTFLSLVLVTFVASIFWLGMSIKEYVTVKQDLSLAAWQLRRIYELASRYEDTDPDIEPALRIGVVLKLGEAQLLLRQLRKFEGADERLLAMRSFGPNALQFQTHDERQSPEQTRGSVASGLATTESRL